MRSVNYDKIANSYEYRYKRSYQSDGLLQNLQGLVQSDNVSRILEVGCGTGHWLKSFPKDITTIGIDKSFGMLCKAKTQEHHYYLVQGDSRLLPFKQKSFDFIFCINAIHHFSQPDRFIQECRSLLTPGGILTIVCMNPHSGTDDWYVYDYFEGTYETDIHRYPTPDKIKSWLENAGFKKIEFKIGERLQNRLINDEVFPIPKDFTSQLSLLSDQAYQSGIDKIKETIALAKQENKEIEFNIDISLSMVTAYTVD